MVNSRRENIALQARFELLKSQNVRLKTQLRTIKQSKNDQYLKSLRMKDYLKAQPRPSLPVKSQFPVQNSQNGQNQLYTPFQNVNLPSPVGEKSRAEEPRLFSTRIAPLLSHQADQKLASVGKIPTEQLLQNLRLK